MCNIITTLKTASVAFYALQKYHLLFRLVNNTTDSLLMLEAANIPKETSYRSTTDLEIITGNTLLHGKRPKLAEEAVFSFK